MRKVVGTVSHSPISAAYRDLLDGKITREQYGKVKADRAVEPVYEDEITMTDKTLYEGKYIRVVSRDGYEFVERVGKNSAVVIIPVIGQGDQKSLVLIKEYRTPLQAYNISLPAGLVGDNGDEDTFTAAHRELKEETGYKAGHMRFLTRGVPSSGLTSEMLYFYLADDLGRVSGGGGVDGEDIKVIHLKLNEAASFLQAQECCVDPKVYMALYFAMTTETI